MVVARKVWTADELGSMTAVEQDVAFDATLVTDLSTIPAAFLERVRTRLAAHADGADTPHKR